MVVYILLSKQNEAEKTMFNSTYPPPPPKTNKQKKPKNKTCLLAEHDALEKEHQTTICTSEIYTPKRKSCLYIIFFYFYLTPLCAF